MPRRSWFGVLKRTVKEFQDDNLTDWAGALTYYGLLSLFPMLLALVAVLGLVGQEDTINEFVDGFRQAGLGEIADNVSKPLEGVVQNRGGAGALVGFGLVTAFWSASGYIGAFIRASNSIYEVEEGRPFWKLRPLQVLITLVMVLLLSLVALAVVITGPLAEAVGNVIGLGDTAVTAWSFAKWPVMLVIVMGLIAGLYYVAPNVRQPRFRWITPGGVVAVVLWVIASVGFGVYVANFGSYNKTYGTLGGVITFLVWMWISNLAVLLGAEFDAELERERELKAGLPAEDELQLPPREPAKSD
jgi:membrane protein